MCFNRIGFTRFPGAPRGATKAEMRILNNAIVWQIQFQHGHKPPKLGHKAEPDARRNQRIRVWRAPILGTEQHKRRAIGRVLHLLDLLDAIRAQLRHRTNVETAILLFVKASLN